VVPALAVAGALRADPEGPQAGADVHWVGGERAERELVPAAGYELETLAVEGLARRDPVRAARAAVKAALAVVRSLRILRRLKPDVVLGGGGYVAGPVGLAAVLLRIPLVLTEADSHLGVTNRLLAPFARRVCLAFPLAGRHPPRYVVTGRPVPPPFQDREAARERLGIGPEETCVLVFGGSLGARTVNFAAVEAFRDAPFRVLHAAGTRDYDELAAALGSPPPSNYDLRPYISPFGPALAASDLVVARAGGSIFEICAHGRPALLVPYPHATADHQAANARWMADGGAAVVVPDGELTAERLAHDAGALLHDRTRLAAMGHASAALARPDAAERVAGEVRRAAGGVSGTSAGAGRIGSEEGR
jgi:UDP-N-acetylglucosamine--N-acetylmuramyl-(pentapeptide) pyrophosphoryl-undecaprenol N-acetylglucosamine transferase